MNIINESKNPELSEALKSALFYQSKKIDYLIINPLDSVAFYELTFRHNIINKDPADYLRKWLKKSKKPHRVWKISYIKESEEDGYIITPIVL